MSTLSTRLNNIIGGVTQGARANAMSVGTGVSKGVSAIFKGKTQKKPAVVSNSFSNIPTYFKEKNSQLSEIDRLTR